MTLTLKKGACLRREQGNIYGDKQYDSLHRKAGFLDKYYCIIIETVQRKKWIHNTELTIRINKAKICPYLIPRTLAGKYRNIIVHDFRQKDTVDRYWGWDGHGETILVLPGIKKKRVT